MDELCFSVLASPASVGLIRDRFQRILGKWGILPGLSGDVLLSASELVTNAVEAAPHKEIWAKLSREACGVLLEVWDPSAAVPVVGPVVELTLEDLDLSVGRLDDNGGRGLPIVAALSVECGYTRHPTCGGKTVWARFKA